MGFPAGPHYIDDTPVFTVVTHRVDTGALTDADGDPAYRVYEAETGTAILNGTMSKLDDGNTTGFYSEQITLSAANGFEVGKSYAVYVSAAVNSVTGGQTFNFKVIATPHTLASINAEVDTALADYDAPTHAELVSEINAVQSDVAGVQSVVDAILVDTAEIGAAGAGLTNINLPDQTMNITGNITGNLSGSVGSVTGNVGGNVVGSVGSVTGLTASDVGDIKTKTDSLTFTVAGVLDSNVQYVNDAEVTGNGQAGTEWGPA